MALHATGSAAVAIIIYYFIYFFIYFIIIFFIFIGFASGAGVQRADGGGLPRAGRGGDPPGIALFLPPALYIDHE